MKYILIVLATILITSMWNGIGSQESAYVWTLGDAIGGTGIILSLMFVAFLTGLEEGSK